MTTTTSPAPAPARAPEAPEPRRVGAGGRRRWTGWAGWAEHLVLAALAFVPLLVVERGVVTPDTKTYLYLDPGRFLSQVVNMWNPTVGLGTVNHQYIGYLLPMGPFYWLLAQLHCPVWVAQRLWMGGILFAAGAGILFLSRVLSLRGPGRLVAALAFMLSPYFLQYSGRISVILLPWAGLGWMVALTVRALRRGGWRDPALFALVVAMVSGINATAILYVGLAPALWLVYAVVAEGEGTWRRAALSALKIALLTTVVCLWWAVGLSIEAAYGVNVLKHTETVPSTSATSNASEVVRGLGYWYFYGGDRLGPWTGSSVVFTQWIWVLCLSYLVPVLAFASAVLVRWRHRAYFILLVVVGLVLSVGAHPFNHPTPVGGLLKTFMTDTTAGLALRSTDRATPLLLLGLAMLLGSGVSAAWRRRPAAGLVVGLVVAALVVANNPALFNGDAARAHGFTQPATLPAPERQAAAHLNAIHPNTRVLQIPGDDFAAQRWGDTIDTAMPALLSDRRPFAIHEQQIMGSEATANMLYAVDQPIQEGIEQWGALAPMARLLGAGDVLLQNDTAYERYGIPQPALLYPMLTPTPAGLSDPVRYGRPVPNVPVTPTLDEQDLATPAGPTPPPLVSYSVADPRPLARAESNRGAVLVAGDATGLAAMAATGLLDTTSAVYYAGTLDAHRAQLRRLLGAGAALVVTDTNRKQAFRWDTLTANTGYTEQAGEHPARTDLSDSPVDLFPGAPISARTLATDTGAVQVSASSYGNPVSYTPENRPYDAIDGNDDTAWETGVFLPDPAGQWWQVRIGRPVTTDHISLTQTLSGDLSRWITRATLTFDGGHRTVVRLGAASRRPGGQVLHFPARTFHTLRITIDETSNDHVSTAAASQVGLAEVGIPGVRVHEVIVMPTDLLAAAGPASLANRLTLIMTRDRVSPFPTRSDPELTMDRQFTLPAARTFSLAGTASISALIPDDQIDRLVGRPGASGSGIVAYSNGRLPGDLRAGAAAALDGNPATAWQPGFGDAHQRGDWLEYNLPAPITFDHLDLQIVADGRHSVPTSLTVSTEDGARRLVLPPIVDRRVPGSVAPVTVTFPALRGRRVRVTVTGVRLERTTNYYSPTPIALPLGIAEVGIPGVRMAPVPPQLPAVCRPNLLTIDGRPVSVEVVGSTATALANGELAVRPCGADASGIRLAAGTHVLATALAHDPATGWNLDQLVLDSAPGGAPGSLRPGGPSSPTRPGPVPAVSVSRRTAVTQAWRVSGVRHPFELVLGQSINAGWTAVAAPVGGAPGGSGAVNLGPPELVDGFANGWAVTAAQLHRLGALGTGATGSFTVAVSWTPQRREWLALGISAAGIVVCLVLALLPGRRRRRRRDTAAVAPDPDDSPVLASPLTAHGRQPFPVVLVVSALVVGAGAAAISSPLVGGAAAVATGVALALPRARSVTTLAALGLMVAAAVSVIAGQAMHPVPESSNWPAAYESAGVLTWMAVVFLGADGVVEAVRRRARPRAPVQPGCPSPCAPTRTPGRGGGLPAPAAPAGRGPR